MVEQASVSVILPVLHCVFAKRRIADACRFDDRMWAEERGRRPATDVLQMSRQEMEQLAIAVASAKLRRYAVLRRLQLASPPPRRVNPMAERIGARLMKKCVQRPILPLFSNGPRDNIRLYDAIEAGVTEADAERSRLGYTRGEELSEDPAIRKQHHMAQLAEMRRRELRAAARNIY